MDIRKIKIEVPVAPQLQEAIKARAAKDGISEGQAFARMVLEAARGPLSGNDH